MKIPILLTDWLELPDWFKCPILQFLGVHDGMLAMELGWCGCESDAPAEDEGSSSVPTEG